MKKTIYSLILTLSFIFVYSFTDNKYTLTEKEAVQVYSLMDVLKNEIPKSSIPMKDGITIINTADSIQQTIITQYKKYNSDTTTKKK